MILTRTPMRVSLFGGGTDYPEWYNENPGAVLGMAINKYVYVGVKRMPPGQLLRYRVQYSKVDDCQSVDEIKHPAVRAALKYLNVDTPLEFHIFADLPGRSGLGASSAFCVGILKALSRLLKLPEHQDPLGWAMEAIAFEQFAVQESVGLQDQIFAAAGGVHLIRFSQDGSDVIPIKIDESKREQLESSMVLVFTGTMRDSFTMADKQRAAIKFNHAYLSAMAEQAVQGAECLSNGGDLTQIGRELQRAWSMKKRLHAEISSTQIDALHRAGMKHGAIGGKLLGAGGGGFMLFFVPPYSRDSFYRDMTKEGYVLVPIRISDQGSHIIVEDE